MKLSLFETKYHLYKYSTGTEPSLAVLRIRDVYPGSEFFPSRIPGPKNISESRIRIRIRIEVSWPKKLFLSSRIHDPKYSFRIRNMIFYPSRMPDPGSKKHRIPDPQHCSLRKVEWDHADIQTNQKFVNFNMSTRYTKVGTTVKQTSKKIKISHTIW